VFWEKPGSDMTVRFAKKRGSRTLSMISENGRPFHVAEILIFDAKPEALIFKKNSLSQNSLAEVSIL
jgi:hypothetical protein